MFTISRKITISFCSFASLIISGCAYNVNPYSASAEHVKSLSELNLDKFQLNSVANGVKVDEITCRASGPITAPKGETYESYIVKAFKSELKLADLISQDSPIKINAKLEHIDFDSAMSGGKWEIKLLLTNGTDSLNITSVYPFESYFVADKACQAVAQAFQPAVQKAIQDTITNPQFKSLIHTSKEARM